MRKVDIASVIKRGGIRVSENGGALNEVVIGCQYCEVEKRDIKNKWKLVQVNEKKDKQLEGECNVTWLA